MQLTLLWMSVFFFSAATNLIAQASGSTADQMLEEAAQHGFTGMVAVSRGGAVVYQRSFVWANPSGKVAFDLDTPISIESITKIFTRAGVLRLEQDGRLSLADPVGKYLRGLPADKQGITIQQLIEMRGGFREYHERERDSVPADQQRMTKEEALQRIAQQPLLFIPGTRRQYSNSGYTLLAAVIEAASGIPYERYVKQSLLEPAGLTSTGFFGDGKWKAGSASRAGGAPVYLDNAPERWPSVSWVLEGSGGMISTIRDLNQWVAALHSGRILNAAQLKKHYTQGEWSFYAGGNSIGFETAVIELENGSEVIILHSNSGLGRVGLAAQVAEAVLGKPLPAGLRTALAGLADGSAQVVTTSNGPRQETGGPEGQGTVKTTLPSAAPGADPVRDATRALLRTLRDGGEEQLKAFVGEWFSEGMQRSASMADHLGALTKLAESVHAATLLTVSASGPHSAEIKIDNGEGLAIVTVEVAATAPFRIERITTRKP